MCSVYMKYQLNQVHQGKNDCYSKKLKMKITDEKNTKNNLFDTKRT